VPWTWTWRARGSLTSRVAGLCRMRSQSIQHPALVSVSFGWVHPLFIRSRSSDLRDSIARENRHPGSEHAHSETARVSCSELRAGCPRLIGHNAERCHLGQKHGAKPAMLGGRCALCVVRCAPSAVRCALAVAACVCDCVLRVGCDCVLRVGCGWRTAGPRCRGTEL